MARRLIDLLILIPPDFIHRELDRPMPTYSEERAIPYGPLALASYLRQTGKRVMVAPLQEFYQRGCYLTFEDGTVESRRSFSNKTDQVLSQLLDRLDPAAIGLSVNYSVHHLAAEIVLERLRSRSPELPILIGGNHATQTVEHWLTLPQPVNAVVLGEAERACQALLENGFRAEGVAGIAWRSPEGKIHQSPRPPALNEQELSVRLDLELMALPRWAPLGGFQHLLASSRGCDYRCAFCTSHTMWGRRRLRLSPVVGEEAEDLVRLGISEARFADDTLDPGSDHFGQLSQVLRDGPPLSLSAPIRLDLLERSDPGALATARVDHVFIGAESFEPEVLAAMNKRLRTGQTTAVEGVLGRLNDAGIGVTLFMLIGHPGSSYELDMASAERCRSLFDQGLLAGLSAVHVAPYPGSALAEAGRQGNLRIIESRPHHWTLSEPMVELVDGTGQVVYSAQQMRRVFQFYQGVLRDQGLGDAEGGGDSPT